MKLSKVTIDSRLAGSWATELMCTYCAESQTERVSAALMAKAQQCPGPVLSLAMLSVRVEAVSTSALGALRAALRNGGMSERESSTALAVIKRAARSC